MKNLFIALLFFPITLFAANWYVRPSSSGANSGVNWNDAWSSSSINWSNVSAGDTVWLAGGSYSAGLEVDASGAAGKPILVYRATSSDGAATSSPGWQSSFDSQVSLPGADGIYIPSSSYVTVDGRTQYGILITISQAGGPGIEAITEGHTGSNLTFRNIDVNGQYWNQNGNPAASSDVRGWKVSPGNGAPTDANFITFEYCRVRGVDLGFHCLASNVLVQHCTIQDIWPSDPTQHPDVLYCYTNSNMIWRYNFIINCETDGMFFEFGGAVNFYFYGNVYYSTTNQMISFKQSTSPPYGPFFIFNNTFQAPGTGSYEYGYLTTYGSTLSGASQVFNNIFYNVQNSISRSPGVTSDYNAYNYTSLGGFSWPSGEAHSFTFTGNPFLSLPPYTEPVATIGNFHLAPAAEAIFQRGITLSQDGYINKDMDGNTRGAHGPWFVGAYEYGSSNPNPTPNPTPKPTPSSGGSTASLFDTSATPDVPNITDSNQLQLGVKFQTSTAGMVTAIRFYKGTLDAGPHVVTLWSADGTLLASATSSTETASGWQQVNLASPVTLAANTTYIVAYHTSGFYSEDENYFVTAHTNGPLTALTSSANGGNGVYVYASPSTFPAYSYHATNYWVDLVFTY